MLVFISKINTFLYIMKEVLSAHIQLIASLLFLVAGGLSIWAEINKDDFDIGVI